MARDHSLIKEKNCQYLHKLLPKDAARFCSGAVETRAVTFQILADMVSVQYSSPVRQTQVFDFLVSLLIDKYVSFGADESASLARIYATIVEMSRQLPPSRRGNAHRVRFMRRTISSRLCPIQPYKE